MVAVAMSGPVGRPPDVARIESVSAGGPPTTAVHAVGLAAQKRLISTFVSVPVTEGTNVCPAHAVVLMMLPVLLRFVFTWSSVGLTSCSEPGVVVRSRFVEAPSEKSTCDVSVEHALGGACVRVKLTVVVWFEMTPTFVCVE